MSSSSSAPKWALLLVATLPALLLFALLETVLRLGGLGAPDASGASRLKYQQIHPPILEPAQRGDGTSVLATADMRLPYQTVVADKPALSLRILAFGGSATAGLGYGPNVTFTRHLERLVERAYPQHDVEIVNLGIVALSSDQVRVLVEDSIAHYEPDVLVVYSGNNEFLEVHAEKFAAARATVWSKGTDFLMDTNVYRLARRVLRGPPRSPTLADRRFSNDDLRVSQHAIIQHIAMSEEEILGVIDHYGANIDAIARVALESDTPLMLMTVASNWRYRGREDLPADWLDELTGEAGLPTPERLRAGLVKLDSLVDTGSPMERWEALYRRAVAHEMLGNPGAARADYRRAMNEDPHLRRALDAMADRVKQVGKRHGVPVFDTVAYLERESAGGIVGFDTFYDYVHFTPKGALQVGTQLFRELQQAGLLPAGEPMIAERYYADRLAQLRLLESDPLERGEWMGFGFDVSLVADRDLWKYERMIGELDERIVADPGDVRARVYRGNARAFELGGAREAEQDYLAALEIVPGQPAILRNLAELRAERPPE